MSLAQTEFLLSFGGVPFVGDYSQPLQRLSGSPQPCEGIYDYVNRVIPLRHLQDLYNSYEHPGRNTGALARWLQSEPGVGRRTGVGEWYYPTGASRYSVFRGLATSSQAKAMLEEGVKGPRTFIMKSVPDSPYKTKLGYDVQTKMRLLPPRPLAEHGGGLDGLYLITLVDERFDWRQRGVTIHPSASTWQTLIGQCTGALGVTATYSAIEGEYGFPDPDSQLWCNQEDAALLLDACAHNVGRVVVRKYDGTYALYTPAESKAIVLASRKDPVTRIAGGDLFSSGKNLAAGNLNPSKVLIAPERVITTFPKYVTGNDPIPHYLNPRREANWHQDSYGETFSISVPAASGSFASGVLTSLVSGGGSVVLHDTAKALYTSEENALTGSPSNESQLTDLAVALARTHYGNQLAVALDEVYPGTVKWTPEGLHDLLWTYSDRMGLASLRVMKSEWTSYVREYQHTTETSNRQGGVIPALTVQDAYTSIYSVNLITPRTPLRVVEGVRTSGGVNEAILAIGTDGTPGGGGGVPGGGYGGTVNYDNVTINYLGGGGGGLGSTGNRINVVGLNTLNFYASGAASVGGNLSINYFGDTTSATFINYYAGTVNVFRTSSRIIMEGDSSLIVNVNEGSQIIYNYYPTGTSGVGCPRFFSFYQHLKNPLVSAGSLVSPGAKIAELASIDTGAHLHFAVGDEYTPYNSSGGTNSMVGVTLDLNANQRWFPEIGQRVAGGAGPYAPNFNSAQVAWILQRLRRPIDGTDFWVSHLGSEYHVGKDYHAVDVHTLPSISFQQDEGRSVYNVANSTEITSRVIFTESFSNGYAVLIQHDKNSSGCVPGSLVSVGTVVQPPCATYNSASWLFVSTFTFSSVTFVTLNFNNLNVVFGSSSVVTFDSTTSVKVEGLFKLHNGWWLHYRDVDVADGQEVILLLPDLEVAHRVVVRVQHEEGASLAGMTPHPDGGAGQVIWLVNDSSVWDLEILHASDGGPLSVRDFLCPDNADVTLKPNAIVACWYDPDAERWRLLHFCCSDEKVKVSSNDTTAGYLNGKLVAGTGITLTENNDGANETLTIAATAGGGGNLFLAVRYVAAVEARDSGDYGDLSTVDGANVTVSGTQNVLVEYQAMTSIPVDISTQTAYNIINISGADLGTTTASFTGLSTAAHVTPTLCQAIVPLTSGVWDVRIRHKVSTSGVPVEWSQRVFKATLVSG